MSVQFDVLDDILSTIRIEGTVHYQKDFYDDWGIAASADSVKKFHIIVRGHCWLRSHFLDNPIPLYSGDIIAFPHGDAYQLGATPESPCLPESQLEQIGMSAKQHSMVTTSIVFGHIKVQRELNHPFVRNLPELLHVRAGDPQHRDWIRSVADMLIAETQSPMPGSRSIVKRLAEVLHLYTIRAYILTQQKESNYAAVFHNPPMYQALQLIHENLQIAWTLEQIAREVGLSRTSFATRFRDIVGITPMSYITMWRMQKAKDLLETTDLTIAFVADRIGYASEAAFSRAFQREFGQTPGNSR